MALSDCEKCWETPCVCGHGYRAMPDERRRSLARVVDPNYDKVLNDNAIAIAEDAFRAGFEAGTEDPGVRDINRAWGEYEPREHIKDLTR